MSFEGKPVIMKFFFLAIRIKKFLHNMQFVRDYQYNAIQHTCQILLFAYQMQMMLIGWELQGVDLAYYEFLMVGDMGKCTENSA